VSKTKLEPEQKDLIKDLHRDRRGRIRCAGCGDVVAKGGYEFDHRIAEEDSTPELRDDPANIQILCVSKEKRGGGCHRRKSAQEAKARARIARGPRSYRKPAVLLTLAVLFVGWAWFDLTGGPGAAAEFLHTALIALGAIAALLFLGNVVIAAADARPRETDSVLAETAKAPAADAPPSALNAARITEVARDVMGAKGDLKVTIVSQDEFRIAYPGTGFDDGLGENATGREKLVDKINTKIPGRWKPHWNTEQDIVTFTRRPDLPRKVPHPGLPKGRPWHVLPFAKDAWFDLMVTSHLLIIGVTNAGKTSLMRALIAALCDSARRGEVELILADPKQVELLGFRNWPGVRNIITDTVALWDMAIELETEMNERFRLLKEEGRPLSSHPRLILVLDEFEQYVLRMERLWLDGNPDWDVKEDGPDPYKKRTGQRTPPPLTAIRSVLSMARRAGIHVIIGTQSPDAKLFGGTGARENLQGRAAVGRIDRVRAVMAFDDGSVGRDLPETVKGRATVQVGDNEPEEFQTYWVPDPADPEKENTAEDWETLARLGFTLAA
jgi:hypothetical protein